MATELLCAVKSKTTKAFLNVKKNSMYYYVTLQQKKHKTVNSLVQNSGSAEAKSPFNTFMASLIALSLILLQELMISGCLFCHFVVRN